MTEHEHKFTIPVEWQYTWRSGETPDNIKDVRRMFAMNGIDMDDETGELLPSESGEAGGGE